MALLTDELNPAQAELLAALRAAPDERPTFDPGLRRELKHELETALEPVVPMLDTLGIDRLWVSKHRLSAVMGCEVKFLAEEEIGFDGWTVPRARGTVAHRAIELSMHVRDDPVPGALVDDVLDRLATSDSSMGDWLQSLPEVDRADLRSSAVDRVSDFLELWPPLQERWRPRCESKIAADLLGDRIKLQGKVDLSIGTAHGQQAGKVIVDLKTGGFSPSHLDDLRFYALIETIKLGVPPRRVGTHYLDTGTLVPEDVTVATLESAVHRTVAAIHRWLELRGPNAEPVRKTGPVCRWCPVLSTCEAGLAHVAAMNP